MMGHLARKQTISLSTLSLVMAVCRPPSGWIPCSLCVQSSDDFPRSQFCHPISHEKIMTRNVVRFAIAMTWLGALALILPLMIAAKNIQLKERESMICDEFWAPMSSKVYITVLVVTIYVIPLIIVALVYCLAGLRLYGRKPPGHQNPTAQKKVQASSRRATTMLITVAVIFALSWLPFQALEMIRIYNSTLFYKIPKKVRLVIPWFGYCNSAINPVLYVILSGNYRREFYRIL